MPDRIRIPGGIGAIVNVIGVGGGGSQLPPLDRRPGESVGEALHRAGLERIPVPTFPSDPGPPIDLPREVADVGPPAPFTPEYPTPVPDLPEPGAPSGLPEFLGQGGTLQEWCAQNPADCAPRSPPPIRDNADNYRPDPSPWFDQGIWGNAPGDLGERDEGINRDPNAWPPPNTRQIQLPDPRERPGRTRPRRRPMFPEPPRPWRPPMLPPKKEPAPPKSPSTRPRLPDPWQFPQRPRLPDNPGPSTAPPQPVSPFETQPRPPSEPRPLPGEPPTRPPRIPLPPVAPRIDVPRPQPANPIEPFKPPLSIPAPGVPSTVPVPVQSPVPGPAASPRRRFPWPRLLPYIPLLFPRSRPGSPFALPFADPVPVPTGDPAPGPAPNPGPNPGANPGPQPNPVANPLTPFNAAPAYWPQPQPRPRTRRCSCDDCKPKKRKKRDCAARGNLQWVSGPKKGKPAGSRCVDFK
jgi:hypothetical protein